MWVSQLFPSQLFPGLVATEGKYASDKLEERAEGKQNSHSMMGVISLAKKT
jgi:hypothetical protein